MHWNLSSVKIVIFDKVSNLCPFLSTFCIEEDANKRLIVTFAR